MDTPDSGLRAALKVTLTQAELARRLGISSQAVQQWRRVPAERLGDVAEATGLPPHVLRPDLVRPPADEAAA